MQKINRMLVLLLLLAMMVGCGNHVHSFGEWVNTKEPTCTENGIRTRTCSDCGETEDEEVPALGHNFVEEVCTECGAEE